MQDQRTLPLITPPRHRNITVKRLILDAYQFIRAKSLISKCFGRQFLPSREYAEIDVTYKCNLKCINCNRSCYQAPSNLELPVADVEAFINQSIQNKIAWKRIRILGGEPTLHRRIFDIIDLLIDYQRDFNPSVRLVLGTNFFGDQVHRVLEKLPDTFSDQMSAFCRLCGHFGFHWPTRKSKQSKTWRMAYKRFNRKEMETG